MENMKKHKKFSFVSYEVAVLIALMVVTNSCVSSRPTAESTPKVSTSQSSVVEPPILREPASVDAEPTVYLNQNWTSQERQQFYSLPQGSHIMPLKFAAWLRKPGSNERFFTSQNLSTYGFIPQLPSAEVNPLGLPVGFTVDGSMRFDVALQQSVSNGERMLGVTCALCHTGSLRYNGKSLRIDGGQMIGNFQTFVKDMDVALKLTREDDQKLERFLSDVSAHDRTGASTDRGALLAQLDETLAIRGDWSNLNDAKHHYGSAFNESSFSYGPGRIDAFNVIFNQVLARDLDNPRHAPGDSRNAGKTDNPVSPPVIWDAPQSDFLQWNGLASNAAAEGGPIARNIGEVLGVFGRIKYKDQTIGLEGYCSTARRKNLETLEDSVRKLWSPKWPENVFGQLDPYKVAYGRQLFQHQCSECHQDINRTDPNRKVFSQLIPLSVVGTDEAFDKNAVSRMAYSDGLVGHRTRLKQGRFLGAYEPAATVLKHAVAGAIAGSISILTCRDEIDITGFDVVDSWRRVANMAIFGSSALEDDEVGNEETRRSVLVNKLSRYKSRPLNGVWSSPPFLHNGSVNSLYELLLPPQQRRSFYLGCNDFDPVRVGLNCTKSNGGYFFDTSLSGNLSKGHDYGPRDQNAEAERMALIEYVKSL